MVKYTLKYFDVRARGEMTRMVFALAGKEFTDERYSQEAWPKEKPNIPLGSLPVLKIDSDKGSIILSESGAIVRYVAREFGLCGSTSYDVAQIDEIMGITGDVFTELVKSFFEKDEAKKKELVKTFNEEKIPKLVGNLEKLVSKRTKGFSIGNKLTLGDIAILDMTEHIDQSCLTNYPFVKAIVDNIKADPKMSAYLKKRKQTPM